MKPILIGEIVGDYKVIAIAGSGGMGTVYQIEHLITRRIEAMKLLPPGSTSDPDLMQRFEREIQVQARLHHPNIAGLYNAIHVGDSMALIMEFVEGVSLQRKLEAGPLPVDAAIELTKQVLLALAYAHEAGVIHRDVSPANIIITRDGVAKLTDFGLARTATDLRLSTSGTPIGSPWYMSPEQVRGAGELDARTDLYAVGAVLHEMLTGRKLFEADGGFAVMRAQVETEPVAPSSLNSAVSAALDEIVRKAVAKAPASRYQSAGDFRQALHNIPVDSAAAAQIRSATTTAPKATPGKEQSASRRTAARVPVAAAVVLAGFYAVWLFRPAPARRPIARPVPSSAPGIAAIPIPVPASIILPAPAVENQPPSEPQVESVRKPVRPANRITAHTGVARPANAIRVTGGDLPAPVAVRHSPPVEFEAVVPPAPRTDVPAVDLPALPLTPDASPAKPQNRFLKALGKVNPFHKGSKRENAESPANLLKKN